MFKYKKSPSEVIANLKATITKLILTLTLTFKDDLKLSALNVRGCVRYTCMFNINFL